MGNTCCQKQEDELILETFESTEKKNNISENGMESDYKVKDKYPHDSDSAFKPRHYEESKGRIDPMGYKNGKQEIINELDEDFKIVNSE